MTSVAAPLSLQAQTEIIVKRTVASFETFEENEDTDYSDIEMTDAEQNQTSGDTIYEEQDTYTAEIESTIVEPPQSDAVMTHAPSTILDEMEYLEEAIDYEEADPSLSKPPPDIHLIQESDTYKVLLPGHWDLHFPVSDIVEKGDATTAPTPPAHSPEDITTHVQLFSPRNRPVPLPRPQTPLLPTLVPSTAAAPPAGDAQDDSGVTVVVDDDWPICLYAPGGQEYILFRSDGDTEALFEDNWLKSQPLETFFSSIRQTLENELIPLTTSFAMDEIVLAIPDLELSIAEDNYYTREISLQDLVNLIIDSCAKNGTERPNVCKILLSFQQRFIARFNQLVALTSQSWETEKTTDDSGEVEEEEGSYVQAQPEEETDFRHHDEEEHPDQHYGEGHPDENPDQVVADEGPQDVEYEEYEADDYGDDEDQLGSTVKFRDLAEQVHDGGAADEGEAELDAAEEGELYEENDETFDPGVQSTEALVNADDVVEEVGDEYQEQQYEEYDQADQDYTEHERRDEEGYYSADIVSAQDSTPVDAVHQERPSVLGQTQSGSEADSDDGDDLISYEEAVDQTEDGQDYRQQYLAEEEDSAEQTTATAEDETVHVNGHSTQNHEGEPSSVAAPKADVSTPEARVNNAPTPKRSLEEVAGADAQTEEPPLKRTKS